LNALECPICCNQLSAVKDNLKPFLLSCGHSFCQTCLDKLFLGPGPNTCPVCRAQILETSAKSCKPNFQLIGVIQYIQPSANKDYKQAEPEAEAGKCEFCGKDTESYCNDCTGHPPLCDECFTNAHVSEKRKNHHKYSLLQRAQLRCQEHDEPLKLHCLTCHKSICMTCGQFSQAHRDHRVFSIKEAAAHLRKRADGQLTHIAAEIQRAQQEITSLRQKVLDQQLREIVLTQALESLTQCQDEDNDLTFIAKWSKVALECKISGDFESVIIDGDQNEALVGFLGSYRDPTLLYRGSRDGMSEMTFHNLCNNKGPTLTVVKTMNGNIFGGFTSQSWMSRNNYVVDMNAWLFSLKHPSVVGPKKMKAQNGSYHVYDNASYFPSFGNNHDLTCGYSGANAYTNVSSGHYEQVDSRLQFLDGTQYFQVKEIEVFGLTSP